MLDLIKVNKLILAQWEVIGNLSDPGVCLNSARLFTTNKASGRGSHPFHLRQSVQMRYDVRSNKIHDDLGSDYHPVCMREASFKSWYSAANLHDESQVINITFWWSARFSRGDLLKMPERNPGEPRVAGAKRAGGAAYQGCKLFVSP